MNAKSDLAIDPASCSPDIQESTADDRSAGATTANIPVDGYAAAAPGSAGAIPAIFGRYRVERLLGHGGMGSVYLAHDEQLQRPVALKIPRIASRSEKVLARLMREARSVAALQHPNICPVYDAGEIDGIHYLAMAYIKGRPLVDYLKSAQPQPERAAALTVLKIAQALEEAHRQGILHRDLKPANIMIDARGEPIVMDFGLAHRLEEEQTRLTQEGVIVGTPAYMSPEQIDHRAPIGPASDIYSLGVVLYELLTQRCPFEGTLLIVTGKILHCEPPAIGSLREGVSEELAGICSRAMAKDPGQRFGSMQEFADALSAFLRGGSVGGLRGGSVGGLRGDSVGGLRGSSSATGAAALLTEFALAEQPLLAPPLATPSSIQAVPRPARFQFSPRMVGTIVASAAVALLAIGWLIYAGLGFRPGPPPPVNYGPLPPGEDVSERAVAENFAHFDRNADGVVTPNEAPLHIIWRGDQNSDEALDLGEMRAAYARLQDGLFSKPTESERQQLPRPPPPRPHPGPGPGPGSGGRPPPPGPPPGPPPPR